MRFSNSLQGSHTLWKSLNFKTEIQGLKRPWKLQSVLTSPWILVQTLSNPTNTERPFKSNCSCWGRTRKDIDSRLFFALNGVLEKLEMCPWMSLKNTWSFWSKTGTNPEASHPHSQIYSLAAACTQAPICLREQGQVALSLMLMGHGDGWPKNSGISSL